eukprot:g1881.t1
MAHGKHQEQHRHGHMRVWDDGPTPEFLNEVCQPVLLGVFVMVLVIRLRSLKRIYRAQTKASSRKSGRLGPTVAPAEFWLPEGADVPAGFVMKWLQLLCCLWILVVHALWLAATVEAKKLSKTELVGAATGTASWCLCTLVVLLELRERINAGRSVRAWWVLHLLLAVAHLRDDINAIKAGQFNETKGLVCWARATSFVASLFLGTMGVFQPDTSSGKGYARPIANPLLPTTEVPFGSRMAEADASFFSRVLFVWMNPVLAQGARAPLEHDDMPFAQTRDCCATNFMLLHNAWQREERKGRRSFFWALWNAFGAYFWTSGLFKVLNDIAVYTQPFMIKKIVEIIECEPELAAKHHKECPETNLGYLYAFGLFAAATAQSWCVGQYFFRGFKLGLRVRAAVNQSVYRKAMHLSYTARQEFGIGAIVSFMQIDAQKLMDATPYLHMIWSAWFQMSMATALLWVEIGPAAFAGIGVMVILLPTNVWVAKKQQKFTRETMQRRDKRVKLTNEVLQGIRIVKLFAWEGSFIEKVGERRKHELKAVLSNSLFGAFSSFLWGATPLFVTVAAFGIFAAIPGNQMTASRAFTCLSLFNLMRFPLNNIPNSITRVIDLSVVVVRLSKFLSADETHATLLIENGPAGSGRGRRLARAGEGNGSGNGSGSGNGDGKSRGAVRRKLQDHISARDGGGGDDAGFDADGGADAGADDDLSEPLLLTSTGSGSGGASRSGSGSKKGGKLRKGSKGKGKGKGKGGKRRGGRDDEGDGNEADGYYRIRSFGISPKKMELIRGAKRKGKSNEGTGAGALAAQFAQMELAAVPAIDISAGKYHWPHAFDDDEDKPKGKGAAAASRGNARGLPKAGSGSCASCCASLCGCNGGDDGGDGDDGPPPLTALDDIDVSLPTGSLVAIVGPVGSGKSSLLSAFINEIPQDSGRAEVRGDVAYCSQQPWIQNATVRDNILFGAAYDAKWYETVIKACSLEADMEQLPAGDSTEIGERGINLSGGQKARVAFARACYADAQVYVLDDVLSAVDAHVGRHLMLQCIRGLLQQRGKTVVMVTHHVQWLHLFDRVLMMEEGKIVKQGSPKEEHILERARSASASSASSASGAEEPDTADGKGGEGEDNGDDEGKLMSVAEQLLAEKAKTESLAEEVAKLKAALKEAGEQLKQQQHAHEREGGKGGGKSRGAAGRLMKAEDRERGYVKTNVWMLYVNAFGKLNFLLLLLLYVASQGGIIGSSGWLSYWSKTSRAQPDIHTAGFYIGVYAALTLGGAAFIYFRGLVVAFATVHAGRVLHNKALTAVVHSPCSFYDTTPLGRIINRFSNDQQTVDVTMRFTVQSLLLCCFNLVGTVAVVVVATPYVAAMLVPMAWVYYWTAYYYRHSSRELQRLDSISKSPMYESFAESLTGIPTIRAFGSTERFERANCARVDHNLRASFTSFAANRWLAVRLELIGNFLSFFAAVFATFEHKGGHINAGVAGLSLSYAITFNQNLNWLIRVFTQAETNMVNVERLHNFRNLPPEKLTTPPVPLGLPKEARLRDGDDDDEDDEEGGYDDDDDGDDDELALGAPLQEAAEIPDDWPAKGKIEYRNVCLRYRPGLPLVLKGVNCALSPGETVGVVGRTGAGKSSMLVSLFRMVELDAGAIIIDGINIGTIDIHQLRSRLAIIPQ